MVAAPFITGKKRWIIVADESTAEIYQQEKRYSPVQQISVMHNDAAKKKVDDLITDHGGRSFDSFGAGRHTMSKEETGPKAEASRVFAKLVAARIITALNNGDIGQFGLIAAPRFLGTLRKALAGSHGAKPCLTVAKQLVGQEPAAIDRVLAEL
ncbi:MAG: host attachment protein [Gammaproteobacteria bacterium]|nr:host attachment protein [Gammaproteobacteria bacterium]MDH4314728.1 host attachment protein [Gammaproteobacteria bacterium]MDH5212746.1 host attachment protein [Gammaproteobacteria bacterium]MDH5502207.1 host attachment protein [Gammaproteobacteria bacterium]